MNRFASFAIALLLATMADSAWAAPVLGPQTPAELQAFTDEDEAMAGGWDGFNNATSPQAYGFSESDDTGQASPDGEAGGALARNNTHSWYADTTIGLGGNTAGTLNLSNRIEAKFEFTISDAASANHNVFVGHLGTAVSPTSQAKLGLEFFEQTAGSARMRARIVYNNGGSDEGPTFIQSFTGKPWIVRYAFNPTGGTGIGQLTVQIFDSDDDTTLLNSSTVNVSAGGPALGVSVNGFGMSTVPIDTQTFHFDAFIDNAHYTIVPEPASLALLALSGASALRRRAGRTR